jgi:mono/diheme cytochrome c family protein
MTQKIKQSPINRPTFFKRVMFVVVCLLIALIGLFLSRYTLVANVLESVQNATSKSGAAYGEVLFQTRGCIGCHTLEKAQANGDTGPNLTGLGGRATDMYIRASIVTPNETIAETCPDGVCEANIMPQYGRILSEEQVEVLVSYLQQE